MKNDKTPFPKTESAFTRILHSELFRLNGEKIDLPEEVIALCEAIEEEYDSEDDSCSMWYLGEFTESSLSDFIAGAFWSFTEWHAGQTSIEYQALCALGSIFSPGMASNTPREDDSEWDAYSSCNEWFQARRGQISQPLDASQALAHCNQLMPNVSREGAADHARNLAPLTNTTP